MMSLSQKITQLLQRINQIRINANDSIHRVQNATCWEQRIAFQSYLDQQKKLIDEILDKLHYQMILEMSQRQQLYGFELKNILNSILAYFKSESSKKQDTILLTKINKLTQKFFTSEYDFSEQQVYAIRIYYNTYDYKRIPLETHFQCFYRIIERKANIHHFDIGYQESIFILNLLIECAQTNQSLTVEGCLKNLQRFIKYQIIDFQSQAFRITFTSQINVLSSQTSLKWYLIYINSSITILLNIVNSQYKAVYIQIRKLELSREYFDQHTQEKDQSFDDNQQFPSWRHDEQFQKVVQVLIKKFIGLAPLIIQTVKIYTKVYQDKQILKSLIRFLATLSIFKSFRLQKIFDLTNQDINLKDINFSSAQKQLSQIINSTDILELLMQRSYLWIWDMEFILYILQITQQSIFHMPVIKWKKILIPMIQIQLFNQGIQKQNFNWILTFLFLNRNSNLSTFLKQIFVDTQILSRILEKLETIGTHLEQNIIFDNKASRQAEMYQKFIYQTIMAIEISKCCRISPFKVILISAEIILKLRLECYWLNEMMEKFLSENLVMENSKMEIQEGK